MADVILSASMSNEELLNSIDNVLGKAEKKFDSFTSKINGKLSKVGTGSSKGGSGTVNVDELNAARQKTAEEKVTLEVMRREKILEKERTLRAQIAAESQRAAQAESRARVAAGGSSYDSAMAMSATTIQQRIEKIKALQNVQRNLSNSDVNYATQLNSVNREMDNLKKANQAALTSGMELEKHNNKLVTSFENLFRRVIFYTGLGAITSFVKQIYTIRGEYEMLEVSMGALVGDFAKGSQIFNTIKTQALKSPFTVVDLEGAAKQLIAYNFQLSTVADTTRRLGDISSALGVPMERIVYNLGQIKAQGVLNARDARDFANAGLAIVPMLAQLYTEQKRNGDQAVTTAQVYDMMSKKLVSYGDVMSVINKVTDEGGMFFNFQAKQAETLKGQLSNLVDAWNNMLNEIGKDNQGLLTGSVSLIRTLLSNWREVASAIESLVIAYGAYKVVQLTANSLIGSGNLMLTKSVLMDKRKIASELEREGTTRTLTDVERAYIANRNVATAADYKASLMSKNLSKSQLLLLAALNSSNTSMLQAIMRIGGLTAAEVKAVLGLKGLAFAGKVAMLSLRSLWATVKSLAISFAPMLILSAVIELFVNASAKADEQKQKIKELSDSYAELSRSISDISASFNFSINKKGGEGLSEAKTKLEELVKLAKDQFGIVIDVDTSKLDAKEVAKKFYDIKKELEGMEVASRAFAEVAVNTGLNKEWEKYGDNIQKVSDDIYVTKGVVADALQKHIDKLKAVGASQKVVQDEQKVLNQLMMPQQANESQIDYLSRLLNAYEQIGIVGSMSTMFDPMVDKLRLLGITGMDTFKTLSNDYKDFVDSGEDASKKFDEQVERLAKKINFSALSKEERTIQLEAAINKNATDQNLTEAGRQMMIRIANFKFGTSIKVHTDDGSLKQAEFDVKSWQGRLQKWAKDNKIQLGLTLTLDSTEVGVAQEALQKVQTAQENLGVQLRKKAAGTATQSDVTKARAELRTAIEIAKKAGSDLSSLDRKQSRAKKERIKAEKDAESELSKSVKNEISLIEELNSSYDRLTKAGKSSADATALLSKEYSKSIGSINAVLAKNKLPIFNIGDFTGKDAKGQLDYLEELRTELKKRGFGKKEQNLINEISIKIQKLTVDAETYNLDKITNGLEKSLSDIEQNYELKIDIESEGGLGDAFMRAFGIDKDTLPQSADEAIKMMGDEWNKAVEKFNKENPKSQIGGFDIERTTPEKFSMQTGFSEDSGMYKIYEKVYDKIHNLRKKDIESTIKSINDLNYKLADNAGKISIEEEKLKNLRIRLAKETNEEKKRLLEKQIEDEKRTIEDLKSESIKLVPFYKDLFEDTYNKSIKSIQKIIDKAKEVTATARQINVGKEQKVQLTYTDEEGNIKEINLSAEEYVRILKQIDQLQKGVNEKNPWKGIKDALKNKDIPSFITGISGEMDKLGNGMAEISQIAKDLGASDDAVETINDIGASLKGLSQAGQGVAKITEGDVIGGAVDVITGTWNAVSTWFDNADKKIQKSIKRSEEYVKDLQMAYTQLERAAEKAMGTAEIQAEKLEIANKKAQLSEVKKQLALEQSRKKKRQDKDRMRDLQTQINTLENEIEDATNNIVNNLLGTDVKSAAEDFAKAWIDAWKNGGDTMDSMKTKFSDMIDTMIVKSMASAVIAARLKPLYTMLEQFTQESSEGGVGISTNELRRLQNLGSSLTDGINSDMTALMNALNIKYGSGNGSLSALQQGIQSITEDTGGAIESYLNNFSGQIYLHTSQLAQLVNNSNIGLGTMSQMLLQLQQSHQVQMAIQGILIGWSSNNGRSVRVEMI